MNMQIRTVFMQSKALKACENFLADVVNSKEFADELFGIVSMIRGYCDSRSYEEKLANYFCDLGGKIRDETYIYWYFKNKEEQENILELPGDVELDIKNEILPDLLDIEKLIVRGSTEGEPITESERAEWWQKQKAKEREEFYNLNGYYEDND